MGHLCSHIQRRMKIVKATSMRSSANANPTTARTVNATLTQCHTSAISISQPSRSQAFSDTGKASQVIEDASAGLRERPIS